MADPCGQPFTSLPNPEYSRLKRPPLPSDPPPPPIRLALVHPEVKIFYHRKIHVLLSTENTFNTLKAKKLLNINNLFIKKMVTHTYSGEKLII